MAQNVEVSAPQAVIIVRRKRGGGDDGHHGGAWKIAYADFMTAMMAFFLVMWLVNSTDEKAIVQVAAYFNPLKLSDKQASDKGLHDGTLTAQDKKNKNEKAMGSATPVSKDKDKSKEKSQDKDAPRDKEQDSKPLESKREQRRKAERENGLFADPQKTLDDIAKAAEVLTDQADRMPAGVAVVKHPWVGTSDPFERPTPPPLHPTARPPEIENGTPADARSTAAAAALVPGEVFAAHNPTADRVKAEEHRMAAAQAEAAEIAIAIKSAIATITSPSPRVEVTSTPEGLLISITDDVHFGMFAVGSAEPTPNTLLVMEHVAAIVKQRTERVIVRGHTDAKPYRSVSYDNWRLSSARAYMAYHMLLRGGINDERILRIEGYADRQLRNAANRVAAENRRIEILLKSGGL
jgi:chemotaxis protein MotB